MLHIEAQYQRKSPSRLGTDRITVGSQRVTLYQVPTPVGQADHVPVGPFCGSHPEWTEGRHPARYPRHAWTSHRTPRGGQVHRA